MLLQFQFHTRRGAFYMLPCNLTLTQNSTGEHCSPLQTLLYKGSLWEGAVSEAD